MEALKKLLNTADAAVLKEAVQRLEGSAYRIADAIYAEQEKTAS
jgi:molecular chaperone DnaK